MKFIPIYITGLFALGIALFLIGTQTSYYEMGGIFFYGAIGWTGIMFGIRAFQKPKAKIPINK